MRIIAGSRKGQALASVGKGDVGAHLRPTTDRVRESLFNVLSNWVAFEGLRVLDLFAGTGALGLEALSRGAAHTTFVDNGRVAQRLIRENLRLLRLEGRVLGCEAARLPEGEACDLVFLDPPYGKGLGEAALVSATAQGWIADDALIVWEEAAPMEAPGFMV
ncbi:MAG: 16S rRNA (guanine(966)-N(2))-methyltransferase RsmD, partial [Shimia sp.]